MKFRSGLPGSNHGSVSSTACSSWVADGRGDEYVSSTVSPSAVRTRNGTASRVCVSMAMRRSYAGSSRPSGQARGNAHIGPGAPQQRRERAALVGLRGKGLQRVLVEALGGDRRLDLRPHDLVSLALDLVHHDEAVDLE